MPSDTSEPRREAPSSVDAVLPSEPSPPEPPSRESTGPAFTGETDNPSRRTSVSVSDTASPSVSRQSSQNPRKVSTPSGQDRRKSQQPSRSQPLRYCLVMRQQPETARNQGFSGEKVNYPYVDPCVILQLGILTSSGTVDTSLDTLGDVSSMVVHAHLLSEEGEEDRSTVVVPPIMPPVVYSEQRRVDPPDSRAKSKVPLANNPQPDPGRTQEPRSNLRHAELLLSLSTPDMTTGASSRSSPSSSTSIAPSSDPYYLGQQSAADLLDGDTMEPGPSSLANPAYSSSQPMLDAGVGDGSLLSEGHSRWEQTLFGHLVSSCHFLSDLSGLKGAFFVFPFLAIRVEGNFRLRMVLTNLASLRTTPQRPAETICEIITDPFKSYTGRDYPGAKESSELSIHFADQGVKIPLRRRNQRKRWDSGG